MDVDLGALLAQAAKELGADGEPLAKALDFCRQRLHNQLRERGYAHGTTSLAVGSMGHRPLQALRMLEAFEEVSGEPWFESLVLSAVRVANILSKSGEPGETIKSNGEFTSDAERKLAIALESQGEDVKAALKSCDWASVCKAISGLSGAISGFFEGVMVMDPDPAIRNTRIGLLRRCKSLFDSIGDFSLLRQ
jgi:glycyl-tRNA synthetase beta chain